MNSVILKLKQQSGTENIPEQEKINQLIELIIKESCNALISWKSEPFPFDEDIAVRLIKEHFGIK